MVFILLDLAAELDLEEIEADYRQKDPQDKKAYEHKMMEVPLYTSGFTVLGETSLLSTPSTLKANSATLAQSSQLMHLHLSNIGADPRLPLAFLSHFPTK
ncbi:MAG: hypothetical protein VKK63_00090 [Synechococcus sp.]|nr:hypothetical protein [Synechococcus sp.]